MLSIHTIQWSTNTSKATIIYPIPTLNTQAPNNPFNEIIFIKRENMSKFKKKLKKNTLPQQKIQTNLRSVSIAGDMVVLISNRR